MGSGKLLNGDSTPTVVKSAKDAQEPKQKEAEIDVTFCGFTPPGARWLRMMVPKRKPVTEREEEARRMLLDAMDEGDTRCGIGPFKFNWMKHLARKELYLIVFCLVSITNGMFFTYSVSVLSTVEKRFKLTSKVTGVTLTGNDISQVILATFLGYYGNLGHRPRWMGAGVLIAAFACVLAAMPHFLYGPGTDAIDLVEASLGDLAPSIANATRPRKKVELCGLVPEEACGAEEGLVAGASIEPVIFLFFSQFFVGISNSIFWCIGLTYLDDNINKKSYPIFYAISMLLRILGPVLGYMTGAKALALWIVPSQSPNLAKRDPRWLGAWWLGYVIIAATLFVTGLFLFLFPRVLPETVTRQARKIVQQTDKDAEEGKKRGMEYFADLAKAKKVEERPTISNFLKALKRLFTNKVWVGNLFNTCVIVLAYSCYWNFKPKYLETQFRKSAAEANYYTGVASLASVSMGTLLGGAIMRWLRPSERFVTGYQIFITLFSTAGFVALMFFGCPRPELVGPVDGTGAPLCSSDCGCSDKFSPMCGEDQSTLFYSPCYAGCTVSNATASPVAFDGCSCVASEATTTWPNLDPVNATQLQVRAGTGRSGYCPEECENFFWYLVVQVVMKTVSATARVSSSVITMRSVEDRDKGVALGTLTTFLSCFGLIPGPIIMGAIIDSACLVWDNSCGKQGNCWLYDSDKFRIAMHLVPAVFAFISVFGDLVVFYYHNQLDLYGEKETDIKLEDTEARPETKPLNTSREKVEEEEEEEEGEEGEDQVDATPADPALDGI